MTGKRISFKSTAAAVLVAGALLLSAGGPALAAGKMGGAGGIDEFRSAPSAVAGGEASGAPERPVTHGGKSGVGPGKNQPAARGHDEPRRG